MTIDQTVAVARGPAQAERSAPVTDPDLVRRVAGGDEASLQELYDRHAPLLLSLAVRILGDRESGEEILQETFFQVWRQAHRYDAGRSSVPTWLVMMTRSRALDRYRSRSVRERTADAVRRQSTEEGRVDEVGHDAVLTKERRNRLRQKLEAIPGPQRQVIELAYYEGLSQREIAERLGAPLGTIKTRTFLAMKKLRESLAPELAELM